jgi:hypothetical protein
MILLPVLSGKNATAKHLLIEVFSIWRSFAYAQDDAAEMCGVGKAERAERSGLPVMLSVSETSHFARH